LFVVTEKNFDYSSPIALKFEAGATEVLVNITIKDDKILELDKMYTTSLNVSDNLAQIGVFPGVITNGTFKIIDDDSKLYIFYYVFYTYY